MIHEENSHIPNDGIYSKKIEAQKSKEILSLNSKFINVVERGIQFHGADMWD